MFFYQSLDFKKNNKTIGAGKRAQSAGLQAELQTAAGKGAGKILHDSCPVSCP